jgi:uncharacterized protein (DUF2132 family)
MPDTPSHNTLPAAAPVSAQDTEPTTTAAPASQPRNPLHGMTLEKILLALEAHYGWDGLGERIAVRCFTHEPSVTSSLKFLRKTPWAREKVESLYVFMLRDVRRQQRG